MASWTGGTGAGSRPSLSRTSNEAKAAAKKKTSSSSSKSSASSIDNRKSSIATPTDNFTPAPMPSSATPQLNYTPVPPNTSTMNGPVYKPPTYSSGGSSRADNALSQGVRPAPMGGIAGSALGEFASGLKASVTGETGGSAGRDFATMNPAFQAGTIGGLAAQVGSFRSIVTELTSLTTTAVSAASKVGTLGRAGKISTTAGTIATNTKATADTASWLTKVARASTNPTAVASTLVAAIGSYPFAGFIKEEALQTLGFGAKTALEHGDLDGAQAALDLQREVLHPDVIAGVMSKVPFANVLSELNSFFQAAELKTDIDQRILDSMRASAGSQGQNSTVDAAGNPAPATAPLSQWEVLQSERDAAREAQRKADEEYYAQVAKRLAEAKAAERKKDEEYWQAIYDKQEEERARKRKEEEDYWEALYKRMDELRKPQAAGSSKLNFGLLK